MEVNKNGKIEIVNGNEAEYNFGECSSNPNLTNEMDAIDEEKIKGDAIGNTLYSERFVLKTIMQVMEDKWNNELENDLCTLWDMTTEKDVVDFLLTNNFVDLSIEVIKRSQEIRLTEIMVGIVGNMCCCPEVCARVYSTDFDVYLQLATVADTPLLIQLMRLFKTLLFSENHFYDLIINDILLNQIDFILRSSQNSELLIYSLQVLSEMIGKKKSDILVKNNFLSSTNEALKQLFKNNTDNVDISVFLTHEHEKIITAYLKVIQNICLSLEEEIDEEKYKKVFTNMQTDIEESLSHIEMILSLCCDTDLFVSMPRSIEFYIYSTTHFLLLLKAPFYLKLLELLINIFDIILTEGIKFDNIVLSEIISAICYMINQGDRGVLRTLFKTWPKEKILFLLKENIMDKNKCDNEFINKFNDLCFL